MANRSYFFEAQTLISRWIPSFNTVPSSNKGTMKGADDPTRLCRNLTSQIRIPFLAMDYRRARRRHSRPSQDCSAQHEYWSQ